MIKYQVKLINEPCLIFGNWIAIDINSETNENKVCQNLSKIIDKVRLKTESNSLKKIEIIFPFVWKQLPNFLIKLNFKSGLIGLSLKLDKYKVKNLKEDNIKNEVIEFKKIENLLSQQADYHHQLYPDYYKSYKQFDKKYFQHYTNQDLQNPISFYFTYQISGEIIGYIFGQKEKKMANLYELIVDIKHRGKGIGSQLLSYSLSYLNKEGVELVELETGYNQPALKLYKKIGFKPVLQSWFLNI